METNNSDKKTKLGDILSGILKWRNWIVGVLTTLIVVDILCLIFWPYDKTSSSPQLASLEAAFIPILIILIGVLGLLWPAYRVLAGIVDFFDKNVAQDISDLMNDQRKKLDELLVEQKSLLAPQALKVILDTIDHKDAVEILPILQSKIYGTHCVSPKGLYSHIQKKLFRFLEPSGQHFSGYHKSIFLKKNGNGKLNYTEFTTYSIHMISLDNDYEKPDGKSKEYEFIEYTAWNEFETKYNLKEYIDNSAFSISIRKDDDKSLIKIFCLKKLEIDASQRFAVFNVSDGSLEKIKPDEPFAKLHIVKESGETRTMRLEMNIKYRTSSPHLFVRTDESHVIEDDNYRFTFSKPSCECSVIVTLPDSYRFKYVRVSPNVHWETSKEEELDDNMPTVFKAHTRDWVLPGLVFACAWEEVKEDKMTQ